MKNLQFLKKFQENLAIFSKFFFKFYRIFGENLDKNLENLEMCICTVSGAEPPDASEFMEIWVEKSMENWNIWIVLMENLHFSKFLKNFI